MLSHHISMYVGRSKKRAKSNVVDSDADIDEERREVSALSFRERITKPPGVFP